jgi:hypothetical protein
MFRFSFLHRERIGTQELLFLQLLFLFMLFWGSDFVCCRLLTTKFRACKIRALLENLNLAVFCS